MVEDGTHWVKPGWELIVKHTMVSPSRRPEWKERQSQPQAWEEGQVGRVPYHEVGVGVSEPRVRGLWRHSGLSEVTKDFSRSSTQSQVF